MDGMNKAILAGHLGADPELRFTQAGQAVLNMRVATTESYLDKDKVRKERTDWHNVVVWGKRGEALSKLLHKGSAIVVEGSLRSSSYDDRDGNKRYKTEVIAQNVLLFGGNGNGERTASTSGGGGSAPRPAAPADAGGATEDFDGFGGDPDDDILFVSCAPGRWGL